MSWSNATHMTKKELAPYVKTSQEFRKELEEIKGFDKTLVDKFWNDE